MALSILNYVILAVVFIFIPVLNSARNFSSNAPSRRKNYITYSFIISIALAVLFFYLAPIQGEYADFLNLSAYVIISYLVVLFLYYIVYPSRQHNKRGTIYDNMMFYMVLASTAGVIFSIELTKLLLEHF